MKHTIHSTLFIILAAILYSLVFPSSTKAEFNCNWNGQFCQLTDSQGCIDLDEEEAFCQSRSEEDCNGIYDCIDPEAGPTPTPIFKPPCPQDKPDWGCFSDNTCGGQDDWYPEPGYTGCNDFVPVCCSQSSVPPTATPTPDQSICWKPHPDWKNCLNSSGPSTDCCFLTDDPDDFDPDGNCLFFTSREQCGDSLEADSDDRYYRCNIDTFVCLETSPENAQYFPPNALGDCEAGCTQSAWDPIYEIWCDAQGGKTIDNSSGKLYTAIGCIPIVGGNEFIGFILTWAIGIAGGIALLLIVYAGIQIMSAGGDPKKVQAGKELLTAAIGGFLFLLLSAYLLQFIGVDILGIF